MVTGFFGGSGRENGRTGIMVKGFRSALSPVKAVGGGFGFGGLPKG